jgi:hypothetical protein
MRATLWAIVMLTTTALAASSLALAQSPSCIPTGAGAAPYSGDWTRLHRDERIARCKEAERQEQERLQARKGTETVPPPVATRPEPTTAETQAAPEADRTDPPRQPPQADRPILRGTDASGVPIFTDDPNLLRR